MNRETEFENYKIVTHEELNLPVSSFFYVINKHDLSIENICKTYESALAKCRKYDSIDRQIMDRMIEGYIYED